jgi:hypothetical protein
MSLTAYVLIAFLESPYREKYKKTIANCVDYLKLNIFNIETDYEVAISTYAMSLLDDRSQYLNFLNELRDRSIDSGEEMYWENQKDASVQVQTAGYALMAILKFNQTNSEIEASKIMKWLIRNRNELDGFHSTTDTVVAIQALSEISKILSGQSNLKLTIRADDESQVVNINDKTTIVKHNFPLSADTENLQVIANGVGNAYGSLTTSFYSTFEDRNPKTFNLQVHSTLTNKTKMNLNIKVSYIQQLRSTRSLMAIVQINLPSGFVASDESHELPGDGVKVIFKFEI